MSELQLPAPVLLAPEGVRTVNSTATLPRIIDLFCVPERYLRSVHLERDFDDITSLRHYVVTPPIVAVFSRIVEGLNPGSGHRAWRITGDYGTGKSSLALMLAHWLRDPLAPALEHVRQAIEQEIARDAQNLVPVHMVPVLVTGAREPFVPAIACAVGRALERVRGPRRANRVLKDLRGHAAAVATAGDASRLLDLLDCLNGYAVQSGRSGVLLVLDELGKFLEYAALHPDQEDVYMLQRIAEAAARSGDRPLVVLGLLHQGFHAYAERLPSTMRLEWDKVAGRYDEITFDQPLAHMAALVAGALNVDRALVPEDVARGAEGVRTATLGTGWYGTWRSALAPLELYPLHPTVLPVLVRFFARFGQHERSLFSFLLSSEPFGLQWFAERPATGDSWYRLSDFYDYIRSVFGHRLAGASYRSHWLRIAGTLDRVTDLDALEVRVLKTVAVLNVLDAEHLLANDAVLAAAIADGDAEGAVGRTVVSLKHRGLLFHRGAAGGYRLWPSTSVNLETAFDSAQRALGPLDRVSAHLRPYLDARSVLARRHYIERGTLRHFEVRYAEPAALLEAAVQPADADGLVVVTLCESPDECRAATANGAAVEVASRPEVIVAVPPPLQGIAAEVQDARCWQWVADNTPELTQDSYAAAEVTRQVAASRRVLLKRLAALFGFHGENTDAVQWWRGGKHFEPRAWGRRSTALSTICDKWKRMVYPTPSGHRAAPSPGRPRVWLLTHAPLSVDILSATVWRYVSISMTWEEPEQFWRQALSKLNTWKRGDQRAVHKPLLTLMLIAKAASSGGRRIHFITIAEELAKLLKEFGPRRLSYHPEFPFWYLQTDGFWEVENRSNLSLKKSGQSPSKQTLLVQDAVGAVPQHLWEALQRSAALRAEVTQQILDEFWPPTMHDGIRHAIGLPGVAAHTVGAVLRGIRAPRFREEVLRAYERRCAICGYDGRLGDTPLGLEAAHIKWYAWHGPDQVDNGLALCAFHHLALDAGALGLSDELHILVSCDVNGQTMLEEFIHRFAGQRLRLPQPSYPPPARSYIAWHRKEVFRAPARTDSEAHLSGILYKAAEGQELYTPLRRE